MQTDEQERSSQARVGAGSGRTTLPKGTTLAKRYQISQVVGLGGMSTVYAARDLRFANTFKAVAVKEMADTSKNEQDRTMLLQTFEREANLLAGLSHPAIPKVYDYFAQGGQVYLILEFIKGNDLETVLNANDEFIAQESVLSYALQIVEVLSYLHNHKPAPIVFRDLKPSNVMLTDDDRIVLIDFGIAKAFQAKTKGTMIGTEGYCPPEQYRGMSEPRGDLYSLGAMMHHMLTRSDPRREAPFTFGERPPKQAQSGGQQAVGKRDSPRGVLTARGSLRHGRGNARRLGRLPHPPSGWYALDDRTGADWFRELDLRPVTPPLALYGRGRDSLHPTGLERYGVYRRL